ncbi:hypothetical protein [Flavobacterium sp. LS1P3]|uniref:hypothetical protein n=1 Tax=Flavobacterium sp. LS1P3 TaxID=3401720 RepID=UPI003AAEF5D2
MKNKYLTLIVEAFETLHPITESTIESKRNQFRRKLLEELKKIQEKKKITKKDFLNYCEIEVDLLKKHIVNRVELLNDKATHSLVIERNFGIGGSSKPLSIYEKISRKKELETLIEKADESYGNHTCININTLIETAKTEMCLNDIEFIESVFENFNFIKLEQAESEPDDLSDTNTVQKIIYLNELGIIDFLRTKPEFMGSVNLMATILSSVTGVKATTLQSSLNRLVNDDKEDKNHPYATKSTVNKVRQTLINKNITTKTS